MEEIRKFRGEYCWLSNFYRVEINYKGYTYQSVENAFISAKNTSKEWKEFCSSPLTTASEAKTAGRTVALVPDWDKRKIDIMKECLSLKFYQEPFKTKLIKTGSTTIIEGNTWGDAYWGFDEKKQQGKNYLGRLIMEIRDELNGTENKGNSIDGWFTSKW